MVKDTSFKTLILCLVGWKGKMSLVYKIRYDVLEGVQWYDVLQAANTSKLCGHCLKLQKEQARHDFGMLTIGQSVLKICNGLPADVM